MCMCSERREGRKGIGGGDNASVSSTIAKKRTDKPIFEGFSPFKRQYNIEKKSSHIFFVIGFFDLLC